jgi:hypothetical protein
MGHPRHHHQLPLQSVSPWAIILWLAIRGIPPADPANANANVADGSSPVEDEMAYIQNSSSFYLLSAPFSQF